MRGLFRAAVTLRISAKREDNKKVGREKMFLTMVLLYYYYFY